MSQSIYIGADHRGFALKQALLPALHALGDWRVVDCGNTVLDPDDDFTTFAFSVAEHVQRDPSSRGVLICHSAAGMCIAANKVIGVRACQAVSISQVIEDRQHNDFQVVCLPSEITTDVAMQLLEAFLNTEFSGAERYTRRLQHIAVYEQSK